MLTTARSAVRSLWRLPAPADARPVGRAEVAVVVAIGVLGIIEALLLRPDLQLRWWSLGTFLIWLPGLLVRRTFPIVTVVAFTVANVVLLIVTNMTDGAAPGDLTTAVVALLIPYSLARWGSGEVAVIGLCFFATIAGASLVTQPLSAADRIGGASVVIAAAAIGAALRTRAMLRGRQLDDVRRDERERLARDLHDTVAHHLTAIAITAQAGIAVAGREPGAATDALRRIDDEATRTLAETRKVLRMLRTDDEAPARPLDDLAGLAADDGHGLRVDVDLADDLALSPTVAATVHRIAQEAVANARRHAEGATSVKVRVDSSPGLVTLVVTDDGHAGAQDGEGFGIIGMTERAELVGGRLSAGPSIEGGWTVSALLPTEDGSAQ